MSVSNPADDFEAAKAVAERLASLKPDQQRRILRWVAESLGVADAPAIDPRDQQPPARSGQPAQGATPAAQKHSPGAKSDIKTFTDQKKPKSDVQFAVVAAYFYKFVAPASDRHDTISSELVQQATRLAGRHRLATPSKTLNNAKNLGYLDSAGDGNYKVNSVGENLVAMTLPGTGNESPASSPRKKRAGRGKAGRSSKNR